MSNINIIAADLGASSGKLAKLSFNGKNIKVDVEKNIVNEPVYILNSIYWNVFSLYNDLIKTFREFSTEKIDSLAIDTWGASFGILDKKGQLAEAVYHYRDPRTLNALNDMYKTVSPKEIFKQTACQPNRNYSLPQLFVMAQQKENVIHNAGNLLLLPDLFSYFLTANISNELSFAGTSALLNSELNNWNYELLSKLDIPCNILGDLVKPGTIKGKLLKSVQALSGLDHKTKVIATCSHDTAAAVCAISDFDENSVYVGSGTNINMGIERDFIGINDKYYELGLKNTGGVCGKNLIYKDFGAFWFINSLLKEFASKAKKYNFEDLNKIFANYNENYSYIDVEDEMFNNTDGEMTSIINEYLNKTNQKSIQHDEEYFVCVLESIALKITQTIGNLSKATGANINKVYVVNGGARNKALNQIISDISGLTVHAGLSNASLIGNALTQLYALGEVSNLQEIREISRNSFSFESYLPRKNKNWEYAYKKYNSLF